MRERRKVGSGRDRGWWNESEGHQWWGGCCSGGRGGEGRLVICRAPVPGEARVLGSSFCHTGAGVKKTYSGSRLDMTNLLLICKDRACSRVGRVWTSTVYAFRGSSCAGIFGVERGGTEGAEGTAAALCCAVTKTPAVVTSEGLGNISINCVNRVA